MEFASGCINTARFGASLLKDSRGVLFPSRPVLGTFLQPHNQLIVTSDSPLMSLGCYRPATRTAPTFNETPQDCKLKSLPCPWLSPRSARFPGRRGGGPAGRAHGCREPQPKGIRPTAGSNLGHGRFRPVEPNHSTVTPVGARTFARMRPVGSFRLG